MGFAWVGGNRSNYVGEDMEVTRTGDGWNIRGYNGDSCSGYRCGEKSTIDVSNFEYVMDTDSYKITGNVIATEKELIRTVSVPAVNNTSADQMSVVTIEYDTSTNWSKTNDYSISESVTLSNTWKSAESIICTINVRQANKKKIQSRNQDLVNFYQLTY